MLLLKRLAWDRAWLLLTVTTFMWGANGVASRLAVGRVTPMSLVFFRWFIVCALLGIAVQRALRDGRSLLWAYRWRILLMAGLGLTGFNALFYLAGYWTTALNITLMQSSIPPFVLAGAALSGKGRITPMQLLGLAVTLCGVALVATRGEPLRIAQTPFNFGDMLMLIACVFYAGYTLGMRDRPAVPPLVFFAALALVAFATTVPLMIAEVASGRFYPPTAGGLAILVFVALGPSLLSQILYMRGIELIGPARAGLFNNLTPIFGALCAVLILGEEFHPYHALALALALGGIWLAEQRR